MGVGGQRHAPAALPSGKTRYPLYRRLGGTQGGSGRVLKISPPPGFDPPDRSDIPNTQSRPTNTEVRNSKYHLFNSENNFRRIPT